jgi:hypothetical protein
MRPNDILICVIVLEIILILFFIDKSEMLKEKIDYILSPIVSFTEVNISIISIGIPLAVSYYVAHAIQNKFKINYILMMVFIWINIMIYVEHRLSSNLNYSNTTDDLQSALDRSHTGDFVFIRSYDTLDICSYIASRVNLSIINSTPFFTHVGMIIKINGIAYVLETDGNILYCIHANAMKSGVRLTNAYDMINNRPGRAHLSRNNLHTYIQDEDISSFMDKYGHMSFAENNVYCVTLMCMFLQFANVFKNETNFIDMNKLNNPELYKCNFKNIETVELKNKYYYDQLQNK